MIWPLVSLMLGLLLSGLAVSRLNDDRDTAQREAGQRVDALAQAYADYLSRLLEQLDLITLHVKHDWEASDGQLDLDRLFKAGLYPSTARVYVTIVNRTGDPVTSTRPIQRTFNIADRDYFMRHRFNPSPALAIGIPLQGNRTPEPTIRFTRRLVDSRGEFDGIVVVSVLPALLASFYADASLGKQGFLTVVGQDGVLRASRLGPDTQVPPKTILLPGVPLMPNTGVELRPAEAFSDRVPRVVASRPLKPYPLMAVVGLSQSEILAAYRINEATYRSAANAGMVLLTLFALVATALSIRLAWRKHQAEQVESTYRMAIDGGHEGFYMVRALTERGGAIVDFLIEDCNERGAAFVGSTRATLIGRRFSDLYSGHHAQVVLGIFRGAMASGFYEDEFLVSPHSPLRSAWMHRRLVRSGAGLAMTLRDISEAKQHEQMLSKIHTIMLNDEEARLLANEHNLRRAAAHIMKLGPTSVIIKRGDAGALLFHGGGVFAAPAMPLADVKDPTGAGDSFAGGLMGYLAYAGDMSPSTIRTAMIMGSVMGSFAVEQFSVDGLRDLTKVRIQARFDELCELIQFDRVRL